MSVNVRVGVNCRRPGGVAALASTIALVGRVVDSEDGYLVWFTQESRTLRGPADVMSEARESKFLLARRLVVTIRETV